MATGNVAIDEGTADKYAATYTISEDALTKFLQRVTLNKSDGTEIDFSAGTAGSPAGGVSSVQGVTGMTPLSVYVRASEYETVAASQTDQMMGSTGAVGDTIEGILVIPATTSPGAISIEDGSTNTTVFTGGASSVTNLIPFYIPLNNIASVSGGWEITTGANVSCIVFGNFT